MSTQRTAVNVYQACSRHVSADVERAVAEGKINTPRFVQFTNNAYKVASGLHTVMQLLHANRIEMEGTADGEGQPMFSGFEEGTLFGLAEASLWALMIEADDCANYAETRLKRMEGQS